MPEGNAVLAIDQGTTGSRALLMARDGRLLGSAYREFPQHFPHPGHVEHDAEEIWLSVLDVVRETLEAARMRTEDVAAVGITNQRETVVLWDRRTGRPCGPAIVWQDRRTAARCDALCASPEAALIRARSGLVIDPYFSATKIEWLLERNPGWRERAEDGEILCGTVDSWLIWRLTGGAVHATDPTNASRTLLYGIGDGAWDPDLCGIFGVPAPMLPEVRPSAGDFGSTDPSLFGAEIPIAGVAGDQQAALYGQGGWTAGEAKSTYGTGAFLLLHAGAKRPPDVDGVLTTVACGPRGERAFAYEGSILVAGAAIQWLRDGLRILDDSADSEAMARSVPDAGGVWFVPALAGLGTPHWEADARGTIVGLTRGTERAHVVRAALEAMAYGTGEVLEAMTGEGRVRLASLRADGGAARNDWLMQYQADLLGVPVHRPEAVELTALGAAGLAGLAVGLWERPEDFLPARGRDRVFEPGPPERRAAAREGFAGWERAVRTALYWARDGRS
ncbi:MAG: glycerol kinase GlpK [Gemmatimonadota bacterium]